MARFTPPHYSEPIMRAAQDWTGQCLVGDGSMLGEGAISTAENFDALDRYFVQRPAPGDASFYEKLETQLADAPPAARKLRSEEHTSELQSLMRISYAVFCLKKKKKIKHILE